MKCKDCGNELRVVENDEKTTIKDITFTYKFKKLVCDMCNKEVFDKDIFNENVARANDELRKITGLIRKEEIKRITEMYKIGNKALSLVLGFGEIQIDRYLKSGNPSIEHSEVLKNIMNNPFIYEMYLVGNKEKISENVFRKSFSATKQLQLANDDSKLYNIFQYILLKCDDITNMSIQKILYFINGFSKYFLNHRLFEDNCEAWIHGPVYHELYDALCVFYRNIIDYKEIIQTSSLRLTNEEKEYIDGLLPYFENYSGSALRNMTHLTEPWIKAREGLLDDDYSNRIIEQKDIDDYFDEIIKKYNIKNISDIKRYSEELFNEAIKIDYK